MSYHMLYDEEGRPEKAIGIKEDLSYMPQRQALPAAPHHARGPLPAPVLLPAG